MQSSLKESGVNMDPEQEDERLLRQVTVANPSDTKQLNRILMEIANLQSKKSGKGEKTEVELTTQKTPVKKEFQRMQTSFIGVNRVDRLHSHVPLSERAISNFQAYHTQISVNPDTVAFDREEEIKKKEQERSAENSYLRKIFIALAITAIILLILDLLCIYVFDLHFQDPETKEKQTYQPYLTVDLIILGIVLMVFDLPAEAVMLVIDFLYLVTGCLTFEEAVAGFGNTGVLTVVFLSIVSAGLNETKALDALLKVIMGNSKSIFFGLLRLTITVFILGVFVSNTALVGLMIPIVEGWCLTRDLPVRAFLMPISIATILGGCCSYIGSSVNIIIIDLAQQSKLYTDSPITFFEIGAGALPIGVVGLIYLLVFSKCILLRGYKPSQSGSSSDAKKDRGYWIAAEVINTKRFTAESAGLHNVRLSTFKAIIRGGNRAVVDGPGISAETLYPGDILVYLCHTASGVVALRQFKQIRFSVHRPLSRLGDKRRFRVLFELVVAKKSFLENKTLRETDFLYRHQACVLGVKRKGMGICLYSYDNFKVKGGDLLLVEAPSAKNSSYQAHYDFQLCYPVPKSKPPRQTNLKDIFRQVCAVVLFIVMIFLSIFDVVDIGVAAFFLCLIFVLNATLTLSEAKNASKPDIFIVLAASIGIAAGLTKSGAISSLGDALITAGGHGGDIIVLGLIYLVTVIVSLVLQTSATAIIMLPIALHAAKDTQLSQKLFIFTIILAASQGFSTPFCYSTNLMIWRPGGYTFMDYIGLGLPLNILLLIIGTVILYYLYWVAEV